MSRITEVPNRPRRASRPSTSNKKTMYSLHIIWLVCGVLVDVVRHWADLPLLHGLEKVRHRVSNSCVVGNQEKRSASQRGRKPRHD